MVAGLIADYAVEGIVSSASQKYPALQADIYKPSRSSDKVRICMSEQSLALIADDAFVQTLEPITADYGSGSVRMFALPTESISVVILAPSRIFGIDREGAISPLKKGEKLAQSGRRTIARLLVSVLYNDKPVLDSEGNIQIFTIKLNSSKTKFLEDNRDPDYKTVAKLNEALQKYYQKPSSAWLTHLVSVAIKIAPYKETSAKSGESSWGIRWVFDDTVKPKPLAEDVQKTVFDFVSRKEFLEYVKNPFAGESSVDGASESSPTPDAVNYDEIPF